MAGNERAKRLVFISVLAGLWLGGAVLYICSEVLAAPLQPQALHCRGAGPMPLNWCGCTWGEVLFQGRPVPGVAVTLTFGSGAVIETTR